MDSDETFAGWLQTRIREKRIHKDRFDREVAGRVDLTISTIQKNRQGWSRPSVLTFDIMCDVLGIERGTPDHDLGSALLDKWSPRQRGIDVFGAPYADEADL